MANAPDVLSADFGCHYNSITGPDTSLSILTAQLPFQSIQAKEIVLPHPQCQFRKV